MSADAAAGRADRDGTDEPAGTDPAPDDSLDDLSGLSYAEAIDVTTPGRPIRRGSLHPIVETAREIADVFAQFGFVVYEGPEIEDDVTNFQMLNIPPDHPARDILDIDNALAQIHAKEFGLCADCGGDIAYGRLKAFPTAVRCTACQTVHEKTFAHESTPTL